MIAFIATRAALYLVMASPALFSVGLWQSSKPRFAVVEISATLLLYAYLAAVTTYLPLRVATSDHVHRLWLATSVVATLPPLLTSTAVVLHGSKLSMSFAALIDLCEGAAFSAFALFIRFAAGRFDRDAAVSLSFPLAGGLFLAVQGGSSRFLNRHWPSRSQRYGVDLVKVPVKTARPSCIVERQASYGMPVRSGISGTVVSAVDGRSDVPLGGGDREYPFGNHVVVETDDGTKVFYAHLERGTVAVSIGQRVREGSALGRIGNSGNSTEPHLHVHAERQGVGIPIIFEGRFLIRNSVIKREEGNTTPHALGLPAVTQPSEF